MLHLQFETENNSKAGLYIYSLLGSITWNKVHLWVHVWHAVLHSDISTRKTINNLAVFSDDNNFITKAF